MAEEPLSDYSNFDRPEICAVLFHPRPAVPGPVQRDKAEDVLIPVSEAVVLGGTFHQAGVSASNILFFHGNGEIVQDYDELGALFVAQGINFLAVDYRGYGHSTGRPTVSAMMADSHLVFHWAQKWLPEKGCTGPLIVMGRSLGSASALEIAFAYEDKLAGLVIESGFAYALPLLRLMGLSVDSMGLAEADGFRNIDKIKGYVSPLLVIHAEYDHIVPFSDGRALYEACPAASKDFLKIKEADHNTIYYYGINQYMTAIKDFVVNIT